MSCSGYWRTAGQHGPQGGSALQAGLFWVQITLIPKQNANRTALFSPTPSSISDGPSPFVQHNTVHETFIDYFFVLEILVPSFKSPFWLDSVTYRFPTCLQNKTKYRYRYQYRTSNTWKNQHQSARVFLLFNKLFAYFSPIDTVLPEQTHFYLFRHLPLLQRCS